MSRNSGQSQALQANLGASALEQAMRLKAESGSGSFHGGGPNSAAAIPAAGNSGVPQDQAHVVGGNQHMLEGGGAQLPTGQSAISVVPEGSMDELFQMPSALGEQEISFGAHEIKGLAEAGPVAQPLQGESLQMHPMSANFNVPQKVGTLDQNQNPMGRLA